jgi:hypothetical protein
MKAIMIIIKRWMKMTPVWLQGMTEYTRKGSVIVHADCDTVGGAFSRR